MYVRAVSCNRPTKNYNVKDFFENPSKGITEIDKIVISFSAPKSTDNYQIP